MDGPAEQIHAFFDAYEKHVNKSLLTGQTEAEEIAACFTADFIESSPAGIIAARNDEMFLAKIPEGMKMYRDIGITSMTIRTREITLLDEHHVMAQIGWMAAYEKDSKEGAIDFEAIYLFAFVEMKPKIFAYITGDEQKALKEHGLI